MKLTLYFIIYENFHALGTVCVLLTTCIRDKTNTKQTHTIINIFIQLGLKIINKIKKFILHLLKFAALYILPLTAATCKLSLPVINLQCSAQAAISRQLRT